MWKHLLSQTCPRFIDKLNSSNHHHDVDENQLASRYKTRECRLKERGERVDILNPTVLLLPVERNVTGHDSVLLHDLGAKPSPFLFFIISSPESLVGRVHDARTLHARCQVATRYCVLGCHVAAQNPCRGRGRWRWHCRSAQGTHPLFVIVVVVMVVLRCHIICKKDQ